MMSKASSGPVAYRLSGGLSDEQIELIHNKALQTLNEVGVVVDERLIELIRDRDGVRCEGKLVRFDSDLVEKHIEDHRSKGPAPQPDAWTVLAPNALPFQIIDWRTGKLRPIMESDSVEMTRLVDTLHDAGARGSATGLPQDIPRPLQQIAACRIGIENCRSGGAVGFSSIDDSRYIRLMKEVVGQPFSIPLFVLNPLRIEGNEVDIFLHYLKDIQEGRAGVSLTSMPLVGATAPIEIPGAYVLTAAAVLAGFTIVRLIAPAGALSMRAYDFDMRRAGMAYGTAREVLLNLVANQVTAYYGGSPWMAASLHSNAIRPDWQSCAQRAAYTTTMALSGCRTFRQAGLLGVDKVFSAEQLALDMEIVNYAREMVEGFEFGEHALAFEAIREVGPTGDFLTCSHTLENRDKIRRRSDLFDNMSFEVWSGQEGDIRDRAREKIKESLARFDYDPGEDVRKELAAIFDRAQKELIR